MSLIVCVNKKLFYENKKIVLSRIMFLNSIFIFFSKDLHCKVISEQKRNGIINSFAVMLLAKDARTSADCLMNIRD